MLGLFCAASRSAVTPLAVLFLPLASHKGAESGTAARHAACLAAAVGMREATAFLTRDTLGAISLCRHAARLAMFSPISPSIPRGMGDPDQAPLLDPSPIAMGSLRCMAHPG